MKHMGRHLILEFWGCKNLDSPEIAEEALTTAALESGATLLNVRTHRFEPHGVSGIAVIAESHISIHTWPELGYAAVDIFTCGEHVNPYQASEVLKRYFKPDHNHALEIIRGIDTTGLKEADQLNSKVGGETGTSCPGL
ncbi:MAG: adenosylmethionine decarboxylase [candidate division KSB1 bacterium]|nr:adenosylmethionine decarboxylase [candidate division KSB1 bacterium]